jgi:hypothetical protein
MTSSGPVLLELRTRYLLQATYTHGIFGSCAALSIVPPAFPLH